MTDNEQQRRQFWENKKWFGRPCPDYDPECVKCIHWEMIAYMKRLEEENKRYREMLLELDGHDFLPPAYQDMIEQSLHPSTQ